MKLFRKKTAPKNEALLQELAKTQRAMEIAYSNFENVIDPELIDSYIYELNAAQERYRYLIRKAKAMDNEASFY